MTTDERMALALAAFAAVYGRDAKVLPHEAECLFTHIAGGQIAALRWLRGAGVITGRWLPGQGGWELNREAMEIAAEASNVFARAIAELPDEVHERILAGAINRAREEGLLDLDDQGGDHVPD